MESTSLGSKSSCVAWVFLSLAGSLLRAQMAPPAVEWEKIFPGSVHGGSGQQTSDGGYIVSGRTSLGGNQWDAVLIKADKDGKLVYDHRCFH